MSEFAFLRRRMGPSIQILILGSLLSGPVFGSDLLIPRMPATPSIDGYVDAAWTGIDPVELLIPYVTTSPIDPEDFSCTARVGWDEENLYVLFEVSDVQFVDDSPAGSAWRDDSMQVYLDPDHARGTSYDANDANLLLRRNDTRPLEGTIPAGLSGAGAVNWRVADQLGGYTMEVAISWSAMGVDPVEGLVFGLDFQANDDDGSDPDAVLKWFDTIGTGYANPSVFASVQLSAEVADPLADIVILNSTSAVSIDGVPDPVWSKVAPMAMPYRFIDTSEPDPSDFHVLVRTLWDSDFLYCLFEVSDDVFRSDSEAGWQDDSIQVYLNGDNGTDTMYDEDDDNIILPRDPLKPAEGDSSKPYVSAVSWGVGERSGGYFLEVGIPWSAFPFQPGAGVTFGLDFQANDDDGGNPDMALKLFDAAGIGYRDPSVFGTALLGGNQVSGETFLGYLVEEFWIDTGDWLGPLYISNAPWLISARTGGWIYVEESNVNELGGWIFFVD